MAKIIKREDAISNPDDRFSFKLPDPEDTKQRQAALKNEKEKLDIPDNYDPKAK